MSLEQRLAAALRAKPEMCSLNMGSMNFGRFGIANRIKEWKFDWEQADLEASRDYIFRNTYADIEYILEAPRRGARRPLRVRVLRRRAPL